MVQYKLTVLQYLEILLLQQQKEAALEFLQTKIRTVFSCHTTTLDDAIMNELQTLLLFQCYHKEVLQQQWDAIPSYAPSLQVFCKPQYKQSIAEWINNKICCLYNHSLPQTPLERLMQQALVVRQQMEKDHIWNEHIAPLLVVSKHKHSHSSLLSPHHSQSQQCPLQDTPPQSNATQNKPAEEEKDLMEDEANSSVTSPANVGPAAVGESVLEEDSGDSHNSDGEEEDDFDEEEEESDGEEEEEEIKKQIDLDEKSKRFIRELKFEFRFVDHMFQQSSQ